MPLTSTYLKSIFYLCTSQIFVSILKLLYVYVWITHERWSWILVKLDTRRARSWHFLKVFPSATLCRIRQNSFVSLLARDIYTMIHFLMWMFSNILFDRKLRYQFANYPNFEILQNSSLVLWFPYQEFLMNIKVALIAVSASSNSGSWSRISILKI